MMDFIKVEYFKCDKRYGIFVTKNRIKSIIKINKNIPRVSYGYKVYVNEPSNKIGIIKYIGPKIAKMSYKHYYWSNNQRISNKDDKLCLI